MPIPSECRPGLPPGFDVWFARACQRDPARRFPTAKVMAESLRDLDRLALEGSGDIQYRIRAAEPSVHDAVAMSDPPTPSRVRLMAGGGLGASRAVGAVRLVVLKGAQASNRALARRAGGAQ